MQGTSRDAMVHAAEEFADLIPPGAQFEVLRSDHAGRFMTAASAEFLPDGSAFLEETPLVAWPLTSELFVSPQTESASKASLYSTNWCENCLCSLQQQQQQQQVQKHQQQRISGQQEPRQATTMAIPRTLGLMSWGWQTLQRVVTTQ
mmetsp:Transcript_79604/g.157693  ORF Transcript_79604/g.157693 Transcript_79604/m.157693 type:complete len:147 (+) Transcript_79604:136-576(+)